MIDQNEQINDKEIERKLSAACTRLILDKPFLGALVLRLPLVKADPKWCRTTATDAKKLYYNAEFIAALKAEETQFMLAHEALHCALSHFSRRQHRVKRLWDIACDYAINPLLLNEGLHAPPGSLLATHFEGMTAEEIYPCLEENENNQEQPLDQHIYDDQQQDLQDGHQKEVQDLGFSDPNNTSASKQGKGRSSTGNSEQSNSKQQTGESVKTKAQPDITLSISEQEAATEIEEQSEISKEQTSLAQQPPPLNKEQRDNLDVQWQQRLAGAAQQAMQAGKLGGGLARMVDHLLQPSLPWQILLAHYMTSIARNDYSYTRPSSRRGEPAIFPRLQNAQVNVVIVLDISGSISSTQINTFLSEVNALKSQMSAKITLHACDMQLVKEGPWEYEAWDELVLPQQFIGGGGTSFIPIFDWLDQQDIAPELVVYFTDGEGTFPQQAPLYPVIWLIKGKAKVPWGQRIQLN